MSDMTLQSNQVIIQSLSSGDRKIRVQWNESLIQGIDTYQIYRDDGMGGALEALARTTSGATTYTDESLINGRTYRYQVAVVNEGTAGTRSDIGSATPIATPGQVAGLSLDPRQSTDDPHVD